MYTKIISKYYYITFQKKKVLLYQTQFPSYTFKYRIKQSKSSPKMVAVS